ncbi:DUF4328 domain-containing protein [Actinophytocola oryzae]|uniref:DUF4328 domain-containing protein n=1 Tax=Actinophytocola oryzae TaxID=502181 RepID=UPI0014151116|nr:DUF4328 domain-containing protein [Actinophytocola oryzae]
MASVLIAVVCAVDLYATWAAWNTHSVVADFVAGVPGVTDSDLYAADDATTTALWLSVLALVASAAVFLTWLWRARVNSERLSGVHHRLGRGWTIGGWFCPIVNLWFPRRIVDDIWRTSRPDVPTDQLQVDPLPLSPLVRAWWLALVANYVVLYFLRIQNSSGDVTLGYFETVAVYSTISTGLVLVAGVLLIRVVRQITEWQSTPRITMEHTTPRQAT